MEDLVRKIQSMTLTRTDAEIAEYILAHLSTIGFQTSTTMAEEIGVSDTSVIRFIRKLGFKGYADFRSEMNARTARQIDRAQPDLTPGEKYLRTLEHLGSGSLISDVSQYTLNNLQKSYAQLDQGTVEQIVDILLRSDRKYIAGFRGTACCAQYMASKLLFLTPHVVPILRGTFLHRAGGQRHGGGKPVGHHGAGLPVPVQLSPVLRDRPAFDGDRPGEWGEGDLDDRPPDQPAGEQGGCGGHGPGGRSGLHQLLRRPAEPVGGHSSVCEREKGCEGQQALQPDRQCDGAGKAVLRKTMGKGSLL